MKKYSVRFQVKIYEYAIQGNHIHLLIKARSREGMQNFFRVIAGHSAQQILREFPLNQNAGGASGHGGQKVLNLRIRIPVDLWITHKKKNERSHRLTF